MPTTNIIPTRDAVVMNYRLSSFNPQLISATKIRHAHEPFNSQKSLPPLAVR